MLNNFNKGNMEKRNSVSSSVGIDYFMEFIRIG